MILKALPPYPRIAEKKYCCVAAVLQMILGRRRLPADSQDDIAYELGLIVPKELANSYARTRVGPEPASGYGTQTHIEEFSVPMYFRRHNIALRFTRKVPQSSKQLRSAIGDHLSFGDDVVICFDSGKLFGSGDKEHTALVQSLDTGNGQLEVIDPAFDIRRMQRTEPEKLFTSMAGADHTEMAGLWIISD